MGVRMRVNVGRMLAALLAVMATMGLAMGAALSPIGATCMRMKSKLSNIIGSASVSRLLRRLVCQLYYL